MALENTLRELAQVANSATNPVNVLFGTVTKTNPLEVNVDQRFTLDEDFLIVTEGLTRYEIDLRHRHTFDGGVTSSALQTPLDLKHNHKIEDVATSDALEDPINLRHSHTYGGGDTGDALPDKIVIREGLKVGDAVLLLRVQGGQQYVVWDKVIK
ncbi:DUF2577 domain-containing protein [Paenibacillus macerans]|uniref:DUF2577 domain-containing protein n=1 Tax=Paenibacillus macerans TaxID=44252 RepID=UPI00203A8656|nr:DUF2577 domain-containing protein [Paenibacillus macerans]MCM3701421.1 DUF2577 domain-containing protein [Paenibacillus macerans]